MCRFPLPALIAAILAVPADPVPAPKPPPGPPSWPMFGGTPARNLANLREKLEKFPRTGPGENEDDAAKWEAEWVLWKASIGRSVVVRSANTSSPVVAGGRVFIGTNNGQPRNKRDIDKDGDAIDRGVLMCFDEKTGKFLWQAVHDKLPDQVNDWPGIGINSTPTVVGDRVYYVSNRCTVVCADANGFADGNDGFADERYHDPTDADIVWEYDMMRELRVFPHNASNCSPLVVGDRVFACTSNGVDESHVKLPSPDAPALICLDRRAGKLLWKDNSPGKNVMHSQWSSPSFAEAPVPQVIHGQGDGWLRGFDPATGKLLWQFDCNRMGARYHLGGVGDRSEFIAMPVVYNGRVYIGTGQDPEHSGGLAHLWCVDLKRAVELGAKSEDRDVSPDLVVRVEKRGGEENVVTKPNPCSALGWVYGGEERRKWALREYKFSRTLSTVAVADGVVYAAGIDGHLHCLNATTGEHYWEYDTRASIWGSPYYVGGKVLIGSDSELFIFRHDKRAKTFDWLEAVQGVTDRKAARMVRDARRAELEKEYLLAKLEFPTPIRTTPTVANGVLYLATEDTLYAIRTK